MQLTSAIHTIYLNSNCIGFGGNSCEMVKIVSLLGPLTFDGFVNVTNASQGVNGDRKELLLFRGQDIFAQFVSK